jgi:hypothetical protein
MRRDAVTRADQTLIDSLPRDLEVTPRKLERWRQRGLVPETAKMRGDVRGSASSYPPGSVDQVAELARMLKNEDDDLDHALLRLFMRCYPVQLDALKTLYFDLFAALSRLESLRPPEGSRASRNGLARTVRFRLRKLASPRLPADELLRSVFAEVLEAYRSGEMILEDDDEHGDESLTREFKVASGLARAETDPIHEGASLLPKVSQAELERSLGVISQRSLEAALRRATLPALERARDQWRHVLTLLADFGEVASSAAGRRRDVGGLEAVRKLAGDEVLTALFVPFWLAVRAMMKRAGIEIDPLWDPTTPEGREYSEFFGLVARLARSTKSPVTNDALEEVLAAAPEELRAEFAAWVARASERTVIV